MKYENRLLENEKKREEIKLENEQKREDIRRANEKKLLESGIDIVDKMSGETFEKFLLQHFTNQGYKGELTPTFGDYGADLVLEKDGRKVIVQAKRWKQTVDIKAVQEVVGAIKHYDADKGMVITNSVFTEAAYNLANSNGIELWDRNMLIEFMRNTNGKELAASLSTTVTDNRTVAETALVDDEICPKCSSKLILRNGKRGQFWGCSGYPQCRYTKDFSQVN